MLSFSAANYSHCVERMSRYSCASLVPFGMKWACTCTGDGDGDVLVLVLWCACVVVVSCRVFCVVWCVVWCVVCCGLWVEWLIIVTE